MNDTKSILIIAYFYRLVFITNVFSNAIPILATTPTTKAFPVIKIVNSIDHVRKLVALYFRFSLLDDNFKITLNGEIIGFENLETPINDTEFIWSLNSCSDPLTQRILLKANRSITIPTELELGGFIASVKKPKDLKVLSDNEK